MSTANEMARKGYALTGIGGSIRPGNRYVFPAWSDIFMRGERYGTVTAVGRKWVAFSGNRSGVKVRFLVTTVADFEPLTTTL